mmetsp:Transcript_6761/g.16947  ORF Transcript_6761/g.16947 Transcript_6761/m.16947 type:complete len:176 (+) Transcript_6761:878-1405(+)
MLRFLSVSSWFVEKGGSFSLQPRSLTNSRSFIRIFLRLQNDRLTAVLLLPFFVYLQNLAGTKAVAVLRFLRLMILGGRQGRVQAKNHLLVAARALQLSDVVVLLHWITIDHSSIFPSFRKSVSLSFGGVSNTYQVTGTLTTALLLCPGTTLFIDFENGDGFVLAVHDSSDERCQS